MQHPQGKKFALCTRCGFSAGKRSIDSTKCPKCKHSTYHLFDSQSEAARFLFLKAEEKKGNIGKLNHQVEFTLYAPRFNFDFTMYGAVIKKNVADYRKIGKYTADFTYTDYTANGLGDVIEDFKPTFKRKGSGKLYPAITADTKLRLNILYAQCGTAYNIIASYEDKSQVSGYNYQLIKPREYKEKKKK